VNGGCVLEAAEYLVLGSPSAPGRKPTRGQWFLRLLTGLRYCVEVFALENKEFNGGSSIELAARSAI